jgi:hypothetical protein
MCPGVLWIYDRVTMICIDSRVLYRPQYKHKIISNSEITVVPSLRHRNFHSVHPIRLQSTAHGGVVPNTGHCALTAGSIADMSLTQPHLSPWVVPANTNFFSLHQARQVSGVNLEGAIMVAFTGYEKMKRAGAVKHPR